MVGILPDFHVRILEFYGVHESLDKRFLDINDSLLGSMQDHLTLSSLPTIILGDFNCDVDRLPFCKLPTPTGLAGPFDFGLTERLNQSSQHGLDEKATKPGLTSFWPLLSWSASSRHSFTTLTRLLIMLKLQPHSNSLDPPGILQGGACQGMQLVC